MSRFIFSKMVSITLNIFIMQITSWGFLDAYTRAVNVLVWDCSIREKVHFCTFLNTIIDHNQSESMFQPFYARMFTFYSDKQHLIIHPSIIRKMHFHCPLFYCRIIELRNSTSWKFVPKIDTLQMANIFF